jgi:hypothetical protein
MEVHMDVVAVEATCPLPLTIDLFQTSPQTQKARGIAALARLGVMASVPPFQVYRAREVSPSQLVGYFSRPCPMRPRHGFVDSREVRTIEEAAGLIQETLDADADAEIVTMPLVNAAFSGIWTPGSLVIGQGHDGATAGTSAWTVPALGSLVNDGLLAEAGVMESPYLEILWPVEDGPRNLVQLRDGPPLPQQIDSVPRPVTVSEVILAEGDLLEWETRMKDVDRTAVVYHPNGSLASHYAIHAVLNEVPVLVSREPKVGEHIEAESELGPQSPKIEALRAGFYLATKLDISYETATYVMLAGCHHIAVWAGRHDGLLGLALGFAFRLTVTAALGEMRHLPGRSEGSRDDIYEECWNITYLPSTRASFEGALQAFHGEMWKRNFGGNPWFVFTEWAAKVHNHLVEADADAALKALNQLIHCAHNTGWAFNKFVGSNLLTDTANNPVSTLVKCAPTLYRASRVLEERMHGFAKGFGYKRSALAIPQGPANMEFLEDDERRYYRSRERRYEAQRGEGDARRIRGRVGLVAGRPRVTDIPF